MMAAHCSEEEVRILREHRIFEMGVPVSAQGPILTQTVGEKAEGCSSAVEVPWVGKEEGCMPAVEVVQPEEVDTQSTAEDTARSPRGQAS